MYRNYSIEKKIKYISAFASNGFCVFSSEKKNLTQLAEASHYVSPPNITSPNRPNIRILQNFAQIHGTSIATQSKATHKEFLQANEAIS